MLPKSKIDEYTRYCITAEGKEYLRRLLEKDIHAENENDFDITDNGTEETDFEDMQLDDLDDIDDIGDFSEEESEESEFMEDEFFRINEGPNDEEYDYWKETSF